VTTYNHFWSIATAGFYETSFPLVRPFVVLWLFPFVLILVCDTLQQVVLHPSCLPYPHTLLLQPFQLCFFPQTIIFLAFTAWLGPILESSMSSGQLFKFIVSVTVANGFALFIYLYTVFVITGDEFYL